MPHRKLYLVIEKWPFFSALVVILAVVIPGFIRMEQVQSDVEDTVDNYTRVIECLVAYSHDLDVVLTERDKALQQSRGATLHFYQDTLRYLRDPYREPDYLERSLVEAIHRLERVSIENYIYSLPDIEPCLREQRQAE